jgi:glutamate-ammonia-ligase adenylyltransferase
VVIKGNKYKLSDEFLKKLMDFSAGNIPPESFDRIINLFEGEISKHYFTFSSESNLLRIISNMFDKISFLLEIEKFPHYAEVLISIASNSNYLTDILVMNPEFLYWIVNPSSTEKKFGEKEFQKEVSDNLNHFKTLNSKVNSLRRIKRKEILRIGAKDILRKAEIEGITSELSSVARVITTELFSLCYNEVLLKYGIKNVKSNYCIVALGKLGGKDLNYSSDIDLIILLQKF